MNLHLWTYIGVRYAGWSGRYSKGGDVYTERFRCPKWPRHASCDNSNDYNLPYMSRGSLSSASRVHKKPTLDHSNLTLLHVIDQKVSLVRADDIKRDWRGWGY